MTTSEQVRITGGIGLYLNFWGAEAKMRAALSVGAGGGAAFVTCKGIAKLPAGVTKVVAAICSVTGTPSLAAIIAAMVLIMRTQGIKDTDCWQIRIIGRQANDRAVKVNPARNCRA